MAEQNKRARLRLAVAPGWTSKEVPPSAPVRRGVASVGEDQLLAALVATRRARVVHQLDLQPPAERRGGAVEPLQLEAQAPSAHRHVLMVRHASGGISFHLPSEIALEGTRRTLGFSLATTNPTPEERQDCVRRGGAESDNVRTILLDLGGAIASKLVPGIALKAEKLWWSKLRDLKPGWKDAASLTVEKLPPADLRKASRTGRNLLFLHGTFSHTLGAYAALATAAGADGRTFMDFAHATYADRIFGFDHFTVSQSPIENARLLLAALPPGPIEFDVVTHSRGGLLLRTLVELDSQLGSPARRFRLGRAALVASPNEGTPLASRQRLNLFLNWIANVMDLAKVLGLGVNPLVTGAAFLVDGLSWMANFILPELAGLEAMDANGEFIRHVQASPGPAASAYSALTASYQPDGNILRRMIDAGVDGFFGSANDLVVPSEGGWRVDPSAGTFIPGDRIGCFAPDGNIDLNNVTHLNFFSQPRSVDFLRRALAGQPQGLRPIDPATRLRYGLRRAADAGEIAISPALPAPLPKQLPGPDRAALPAPAADQPLSETMYLTILEPDLKKKSATLVASFRNATLVQKLELAGGRAGHAYFRIIDLNNRIRDYVNGVSDAEPPKDEQLVSVGMDIFSRLFPGDVQRLYDAARAAQANGRLNVILTSDHTWVADLPYEFAHDPVRRTFLATSEVNFTRNIITAVPADRGVTHRPPLRILVVVAQPLGLAHLSVDQETEAIRGGFKRLTDSGLATVQVLLDATPERTHRVLAASDPFDIVHFIGHGQFSNDKPGLVFQDEDGRKQTIDPSQAQQLFCRRGIRLVFLNACETSRESRPAGSAGSVFSRGLAQALVAGGVPTVVANQFSVLDVSATTFAQHFYWSLAHGGAVGDAARESRISVNLSIPGENIDWAVPVIFARDPAECLIEPTTAAETTRPISREGRREVRRSARHPRNWGLWDVQGILPNLDELAHALSNCQDEIGFVPIRFSTPLGTWRRQAAGASGKTYLDAPEVARRLEGKPRELGVDRLIAITNMPLKAGGDYDLRFWGDEKDYAALKGRNQEVPLEIAIVSMNSYQHLFDPPRFTPDRLIANSIAEMAADIFVHAPGARGASDDCPLFYNPKSLIEFAAGRLKLCTYCRARLKKQKHGDRIPLVEKLLAAL